MIHGRIAALSAAGDFLRVKSIHKDVSISLAIARILLVLLCDYFCVL